jgi:hypothetical protein
VWTIIPPELWIASSLAGVILLIAAWILWIDALNV